MLKAWAVAAVRNPPFVPARAAAVAVDCGLPTGTSTPLAGAASASSMAVGSAAFARMPFPEKLYYVLEDPTSNHLIRWEGENAFRIVSTSVDEFTATILPQLCKSNSLCSLIRQLNAYSFQKVGKSDEVMFKHDGFVRGTPEFGHMKRRKPRKRRPASAGGEHEGADEDDESGPATAATTSPAAASSPLNHSPAASRGDAHGHAYPQALPQASAAAPSRPDPAMRDMLIAAMGCLQDMAAAMRHVASAGAHPESTKESLLSTSITSSISSARALRRFIDDASTSMPPGLRRSLPSSGGGAAGSALPTPGLDLEAADRVLSGMIAAVATNRVGAGVAAGASGGSVGGVSGHPLLGGVRLGMPGSRTARGEETFSSVTDESLVLEEGQEEGHSRRKRGGADAELRLQAAQARVDCDGKSGDRVPTAATQYGARGVAGSVVSGCGSGQAGGGGAVGDGSFGGGGSASSWAAGSAVGSLSDERYSRSCSISVHSGNTGQSADARPSQLAGAGGASHWSAGSNGHGGAAELVDDCDGFAGGPDPLPALVMGEGVGSGDMDDLLSIDGDALAGGM